MTDRGSFEYDVIIVGARCSGATLATFLARAGLRVLLLDKDAMPSDHVLSTHSINPPGMEVLDQLGVGEAVRALAPRNRIIRVSLEGEFVEITLPTDHGAYCPRRDRLDGLLQGAAVAAGAILLDRTRVTGLIVERGRVCGVRATRGDHEQTLRAALVVGADGRNSSVARWVGAEEYLGYDAPRATYWGYWNAPDSWRTDPAYRFDLYMGFMADQLRAIFQTDGNQLLIASSPPVEQAAAWRIDPAGALRASLEADPLIAPLIRGVEPTGPVIGTVKERFFFRRAAGSGWALVGDARHHKEFMLGDGITEALLQARSLAPAIVAGGDLALARWWRACDVEALPLFYFGRLSVSSEPRTELQRILFSKLATIPDLEARMIDVIVRRRSPFDALPIGHVARCAWEAVREGRWSVFGDVAAAGREVMALQRERWVRQALRAEVESRSRSTRRAA